MVEEEFELVEEKFQFVEEEFQFVEEEEFGLVEGEEFEFVEEGEGIQILPGRRGGREFTEEVEEKFGFCHAV